MIHTYTMNEILQDKNRNLLRNSKTGRPYRQEATRPAPPKRFSRLFQTIVRMPGKLAAQMKTFPAHWRIEL